MRALVVFDEGSPDHPLARFLKPGFGHVFVCIENNGYWIKADARRGIPGFEVLTLGSFDLAGFYREHGYTVVETEQQQRSITGPFLFANCVGMVVAILCLKTWAVTPYQLFKYLTRPAMTLLPGFDGPSPPPPPPPPPSQTDPATQQAQADAQDALLQAEKRRKGRASTILTPPTEDGLGDTNLDRPGARSSQLLGD